MLGDLKPKEKIIPLDRFKPRPYQYPFVEAFEQQQNLRYLLIWARRCLSGDSHITMADGSWKFLKDIEIGDKILSWNGSKFVADIVKDKWKTEDKETKIVKSHGFLPIVCSGDHVFAMYDIYKKELSWEKACKFKPGKQALHYVGIKSKGLHNPHLAEFIGYMTCDGYVVGYQQPKFTNINLDILYRVEHLAKELFGCKVIWRKKGNAYDLGLSNGTKGGGHIKNKIKELFRDEKMDIPKSKKRLLSHVWTFDEESILRFFCAVISSDGSLYLHKPRKMKGKIIPATGEITINCGESYDLCWDMYWLLRKIGIIPHVPYKEKGSNRKIKISNSSSVKKLLGSFPIYGKKDKQQLILNALTENKFTHTTYKNCVRLKANVNEHLVEKLYDIETEKHHNFIANGYVVHNSGKDVCAFNLTFRAAMRRIGVYFYILPSYTQCRKVIWDSINNDGQRFLDYIPREAVIRKNSQEQKITLINGSIIQLIGSDNIDSIMGSNPAGAVFSEYALQSELAYQYLRPIFIANGGWMVFVSTVRGHNHFYDLYQAALSNKDDWFISKLTVEDTGHISLEQIQKDIDEGIMSYDISQQEYFCNFNMGAAGAFYSKQIDKMRREDRITSVLYDSSLPVHTAWDIGINDPTAIIFFQITPGNSIHIIDVYEKAADSLEAHIKYVKEQEYIYGFHIGPHDIKQREQSDGITRWEKAHALGITFRVAPGVAEKVYVQDGIEAVRTIFSRLYIDSRLKNFIRHLENYSQEYDHKTKRYKAKPRHDHHGHSCDALRYLATSLHLLNSGMTQEDIERAKIKARQGRGDNTPRPFRSFR